MSPDDVFIAGVGMSPFGRHTTMSVKELTAVAVSEALRDAGCTAAAIGAAWFANTRQGLFEGQNTIRGQCALRGIGFEGLPIVNCENACASSTTGVNQAFAQLKAGLVDVALVVGTEKMNYPEQRERMFAAFEGSIDRELGAAQIARHLAIADEVAPRAVAPSVAGETRRHSIFMETYAATARLHMQWFGTTRDQIAAVAAKNHFHSTFNPLAHYRRDWSPKEVLADVEVAWPLTRAMCAPISDGSAALVLVRGSALGRVGHHRRAVRIRASQVLTGVAHPQGDHERHVVALAGRRAFEQAGIGPDDVGVAEVHDATAFSELHHLESLGFFQLGAAGPAAEAGLTRLGGARPVNLSGGLVSRGHPIAATGAAQLVELVTQLRGEAGARQAEDARVGLAENSGGYYDGEEAVSAVTILSAS